jgi:hypothetical protein
MTKIPTLTYPNKTAEVILFSPLERKNEPSELRDKRMREFLRRIYRDPDQPMVTRVKAAILAPYFGDRLSA